jgi:CheY-like chemotaxis protein
MPPPVVSAHPAKANTQATTKITTRRTTGKVRRGAVPTVSVRIIGRYTTNNPHRKVGASSPLTSRSMPTVLVVADGSWVTNEVRSALSLGSWQIEEIDDPRSVTERLEESRVDAVVIDMQVGSKGGMAVVRSIRQATDQLTRPRTVLLLDRTADRFLARRAGADASVLKPINATELREALGMAQLVPVADEEE